MALFTWLLKKNIGHILSNEMYKRNSVKIVLSSSILLIHYIKKFSFIFSTHFTSIIKYYLSLNALHLLYLKGDIVKLHQLFIIF